MKKTMTILLLLAVFISGCFSRAEDYPIELDDDPVPTPSTFDDALSYMDDYAAEKRMIGMWAVLDYPTETERAVPLLIQNLYYETTPDVRQSAASVLGNLGGEAVSAVPYLINVAENDTSINVQIHVAIALGRIGEKIAVPTLVNNLYKNNFRLAVNSAKSISILAGENFPDADVDSHGYTLGKDGVPLIVKAAQEWWNETGQHLEWK